MVFNELKILENMNNKIFFLYFTKSGFKLILLCDLSEKLDAIQIVLFL